MGRENLEAFPEKFMLEKHIAERVFVSLANTVDAKFRRNIIAKLVHLSKAWEGTDFHVSISLKKDVFDYKVFTLKEGEGLLTAKSCLAIYYLRPTEDKE